MTMTPAGVASSGIPASRDHGVETKSPAELQEIAARYHLKITGKAGNTWERILVCTVFELVLVALIATLLSFLPVRSWVRVLLFLGATLSAVSMTTWWMFIVEVPQLVGVKAINLFGGRVHVFMPGLNIRYPWEQVTQNDYLTLRSGITSRAISTLTADGLVATFKNSMLRWRVFPPLLLLNASHSEETVDKASEDIFESVVRKGVSNENLADLNKKLPDLQEDLEETFHNPTPHYQDAHHSTFEEQYGVVAELVALGSLVYPKDYAEAREGDATMAIYHQRASTMVEQSRPAPGQPPTMTYAQAMDAVMMNAKEAITKNIQEFRLTLDESSKDVLKEAGPAVAAAASAFAGARGRRRPTRPQPQNPQGQGEPS